MLLSLARGSIGLVRRRRKGRQRAMWKVDLLQMMRQKTKLEERVGSDCLCIIIAKPVVSRNKGITHFMACQPDHNRATGCDDLVR